MENNCSMSRSGRMGSKGWGKNKSRLREAPKSIENLKGWGAGGLFALFFGGLVVYNTYGSQFSTRKSWQLAPGFGEDDPTLFFLSV